MNVRVTVVSYSFHASNDFVIIYGTKFKKKKPHLLAIEFILGPASSFELLRLRKSAELLAPHASMITIE